MLDNTNAKLQVIENYLRCKVSIIFERERMFRIITVSGKTLKIGTMKFRVFFRTTGFPLLLSAYILWPPVDRISIRLILFIGILAFLLIRFTKLKRLYLSGLSVNDDGAEFQFFTSQFTNKHIHFNREEINGMQISKAKFTDDYSGVLRVHVKQQWYTFLIMDKKTFCNVEHIVKEPNIRFC
jgi:hypothetical protein